MEPRIQPLPVIGRFVSCGLLSLAMSLAWRLTAAPSRVGIVSALVEVTILLAGFVIGGLAWYWRDVRRQAKTGNGASEMVGFSLVVFVAMPLAVIVLLALVWIVALFIG